MTKFQWLVEQMAWLALQSRHGLKTHRAVVHAKHLPLARGSFLATGKDGSLEPSYMSFAKWILVDDLSQARNSSYHCVVLEIPDNADYDERRTMRDTVRGVYE